MLYAVIMAGGSGTRLWPLSRRGQPKQALKLIGDRTMFQHAVERLSPLFPPERIFVVANATIVETLQPQVPELPAVNFIIEPAGRDSAPAAGLAALELLRQDPDAVIATVTADHYIVDAAQFRRALAAAAEVAADGTIVTLGIEPTYPATGYGYIHLGSAQIMSQGFRVYEVARFIEKPDLPTAIRFLEEGRYAWNSGMFVWRADRLMAEFADQLPELHRHLSRIAAASDSAVAKEVLRAEWAAVERISIDYGIMERAGRVSVIPVDIGWSDIGNWASLLDILPGDDRGNVVLGEMIGLENSKCFVRSEPGERSAAGMGRGDGRLVVAIGLRDLIIVDTPDVLLVCPKDRAEEVRTVVARLAAAGKDQYL
jgi:mannose-1-phosphate guanylyltransferase